MARVVGCWATLAGLVTGVVIGFTSDYYTSSDFHPVMETARVSGSGAAINIITGFSYGLIGIVPSIFGIVMATLFSYYLAELSGIGGIYGVGISAVGMLAVSGMLVEFGRRSCVHLAIILSGHARHPL